MKYFLLLILSAAGLMATDATGTWTGTLTPDGGDAGPAHIVLKQEGAKLTGTAGPTADEQREIRNGKVEDGKVTFEVVADDARMKFALKQDGDQMKGEGTRERDGETKTATLVLSRSK